MENSIFTYKYSATQNKEVESIRKKYLPKEEDRLEALRRMDRAVQNAGVIEGITVGTLGCLTFGAGMCIGLDVLSGGPLWAVILGAVGIAIMLPAYGVYKKIAARTRARLVPEIIKLSEELTGSLEK